MKIPKQGIVLLLVGTTACSGVAPTTGKPAPTVSTNSTGEIDTSRPGVATSPGQQPALGILVAFANGNGAQNGGYDLALVSVDGKVVARAHAAVRSIIHSPGNGPGGAAAINLPELSASSTRVYYLDGDRDLRFLKPDGSAGLATRVPGTDTAHAAFAVSPDDRRIAVSVIDYSASPPTLRLFVEDLGGGGHTELFSSRSSYVWPVGWYRGALVLAATAYPPFTQQGLVWNPYDAPEYHVVSATDATRLATVGRDYQAGCQPLGPVTEAGTACYHRTATAGGAGYLSTLDWSGRLGSLRVPATDVGGSAAISPAGDSLVGCCDSSGTAWVDGAGGRFSSQLHGSPSDWPCFIDDSNLLFGFIYPTANQHPQIINLRRNMDGMVPIQVPAAGFCAGVFPAALN